MPHAQMGRQSKTGSQGAREATGLIGRSGEIRKPEKPGPKGHKPLLQKENDVLDMIVVQFDDVYRELNEHLRLIAKIQQQVNGLIATRW